MTLFAHSLGKQARPRLVRGIFFGWIFFFALAVAPGFAKADTLFENLDNREFHRPAWYGAGAVTGIFLVSQGADGPSIFGGLYAISTLYLMNEWYTQENDVTELIVPFGSLVMSVTNFALLSNDDKYDKNDVFVYNLAGSAALVGYAYWEHRMRSRGIAQKSAPRYQLAPFIASGATGVNWTLRY
jgi:hypothetical protein